MRNNASYITQFRRESKPKVNYCFTGFQDFSCAICDRWSEMTKTAIGRRLWIDHTVRYRTTVLVIPCHHDTCRELFELNPLVYLKDAQT